MKLLEFLGECTCGESDKPCWVHQDEEAPVSRLEEIRNRVYKVPRDIQVITDDMDYLFSLYEAAERVCEAAGIYLADMLPEDKVFLETVECAWRKLKEGV